MSERELRKLIAKKENLFAILQKLYDLSKDLSTESLKNKFRTLMATYEETKNKIYDIIDEINNEQFQLKDDYVPDYKIIQTINELCCFIQAAMEKIKLPVQNTGNNNSGSSFAGGSGSISRRSLQTPDPNLPEFHGEIRQWETFHALYNSMVHSNPNLTNLDRIHLLVGSLKGPAQSVYSGIALVPGNYDIIYKALCDKYENKRLLAKTYLEQIMDFKSINFESEKNLNLFLERFDTSVAALKNLNIPDLTDFIFTYIALSKLDHETVRAFEADQRNTDFPKYADLITFIRSQTRILTMNKSSGSGGKSTMKTFFVNENQDSKSNCCQYCKKSFHYIGRCDKFKHLTPQKRYEVVKNNNWCFVCLSSSHGVRTCPSNRVCSECNRRHHFLLCFTKDNQNQVSHRNCGESSSRLGAAEKRSNSAENRSNRAENRSNAAENRGNAENVETYMCSRVMKQNTQQILGTVTVSILNSCNKNNKVRFLYDSCSMSNLLTVSCCKKLGLTILKIFSSTTVSGLGGGKQKVRGKTILTIASRHNLNKKYTIEAFLVDKISNDLPKSCADVSGFPELHKLCLADDNFYRPGEIDGIIGVELYGVILGKDKVISADGTVAVETDLGYVVMGKIPIFSETDNISTFLSLNEEQSIEELVTRFWEVEQVPNKPLVVPEEKECDKIYSTTYSRDATGRFTVALPFKLSAENLGDSRTGAHCRLLSLERRLKKDLNLRLEYNKAIQTLLDNGYMASANLENNENAYYIAHHPVIKLSSTSTPIRIVLDASAPCDNQVSLNDILYSGPKLQADIVTLLLNFRLFRVAITSDLKKMYLQIKLVPDHWRYQRLLWRFDPEDEIKTYEMRVVAFGIRSSPYLALRTVKQLVTEEGERYPLAAEFVSRDLYMDDYCCSIDSDTEAIQLYYESVDLFKSGGFDIVKWSSNTDLVLQNIPVEKRLTGDAVVFKSETKILGIQWDPESDTFGFEIKIPDAKCTKRAILSAVAQCFDPIGLLAPFILYLKALIKQLWLLKIGWDEKPPKSIIENWQKVLGEWGELKQFKVPRHIGATVKQPVIILGFADASTVGYGAVIYLRTVSSFGNNDVNVQLVCAKSKVTPAKTMTIPRIELLASHLLSKLLKLVVMTYQNRILISKILAFSDSSTVISWIKMPYLKDIFVANRVSQIKDNVQNALWHHIEGKQNPADPLSRGLTPSELISHKLWLNGPTWISLPEERWPDFSKNGIEIKKDIESEVMVVELCKLENPILNLMKRVSSFSKILRITVYVLRFTKILTNRKGLILASELKKAELIIIRSVQLRHFKTELSLLNAQKKCTSTLKRLDPFVEDGLLRVGGRIRNSNLRYSKKHPFIIPAKDVFTERLVDYYHQIYLHTGAYLLEAILRQNYWICGGRSLIRSRIYKCNRCFRLNPKIKEPLMASLPSVRVSEAKPFQNTGVDYFGPFKVSLGKRKNAAVYKGYVSLFVCMSVKAIHLELVSSLSTDHFVQAFKRFISRRGPVKALYSDRGTNFVGAKNVLSDINQFINSPEYTKAFETELGIQGVEWHFNSPSAPEQGGLWESNVKSVKNHIYRVIGDQVLTYEEFSTLLTEIEALLNSRPLCQLSVDPMAPEALTPAHFLTLTPLRGFPADNFQGISLNRLDRFQLIDRMVQDFWKRWRQEYLTTLQIRKKWSDKTPNIAVGTVVLLKTDNAPPLHWPLAVVTEAHPGSDGVVRNVTLKTSKGMFTRPVVKLCPLPTQ